MAPSRLTLERLLGASGGVPVPVPPLSSPQATRTARRGSHQPRMSRLRRGIRTPLAQAMPAADRRPSSSIRPQWSVTERVSFAVGSLLERRLVVVKLEIGQIGQEDGEVEREVAVRVLHEVE